MKVLVALVLALVVSVVSPVRASVPEWMCVDGVTLPMDWSVFPRLHADGTGAYWGPCASPAALPDTAVAP